MPARMPIPRRGLVLFRVGPIEVAVHPSWFVIFGILLLFARAELVPSIVGDNSGWAALLSIAIALLFYSFILAHELSHAIVARAHGIDARRITLFIFGGVAQIGGEAQRPAHEFRIAIAGPLMSLFIAGALAAVARALHPAAIGDRFLDHGGLWADLAMVNLALALFNLIPAFPLDGGRLLRAGLWGGLRDRARATRWASNLGKAFAFLLMGAGGATAAIYAVRGETGNALPGLWYIVLGYFLFSIAGSAGRTEGGARPRVSTAPPPLDPTVRSRDLL
jgi:Zn-dependent protease